MSRTSITLHGVNRVTSSYMRILPEVAMLTLHVEQEHKGTTNEPIKTHSCIELYSEDVDMLTRIHTAIHIQGARLTMSVAEEVGHL